MSLCIATNGKRLKHVEKQLKELGYTQHSYRSKIYTRYLKFGVCLYHYTSYPSDVVIPLDQWESVHLMLQLGMNHEDIAASLLT